MKVVALSLAITALAAGVSHAAEDPLVAKGRAYVQTNCAACHAVGPTGNSPLPTAPKFRDLGRAYDFNGLPAALKMGVAPVMPTFTPTPAEGKALIAYMKSIQAPPKPAAR